MVQTIPVKPVDVTWTDDQWKAIYASGQDTLVSAAAGSGTNFYATFILFSNCEAICVLT